MRCLFLGILALITAYAPSEVEAAPLVLRDSGVTRLDRTGTVSVGLHDRGARIVDALRTRARELGLDRALASGMQLRTIERPTISNPDVVIVIVEGSFGGVPLLRPVARVVVDLRDGGRVRLLTTGGPVGPVGALRTSLSEAEAVATLDASGLPGARGAAHAELVAVPGTVRTHLMWRVDPPLDLYGPTNPVFLVDAETGAIVVDHERVRFSDVRAFEYNPVATPAADVFTLIDIDPNPPHLIGTYFEALDCNEEGFMGRCTSNATAAPDANGDFLFPIPDVTVEADNLAHDDLYAQVSMYYHADKFMQWLRDAGFVGLPCHVDGERATLIANYKRFDDDGEPLGFDNAFYGGDCDRTMSFGQGTQVDFSYDGDVVYHELGHGVVDQQMVGDYLGRARRREEALAVDAGGINEAISDFVSSAYAGDPLVADYVGKYWTNKLTQPYIRDNSNEFVCPHDLIGEVHADGEPYAALLWHSFEALGDETIPAMLDTITVLPGDSTLEEASAAFEEMVETLLGAGAAATVADEIAARGMDECPRITTYDRLRKAMYVQPARNYLPHAPPPLQLRFDIPAGAESMELTYEIKPRPSSFEGDEPDADLQAILLVKYDTPVTYEYAEGMDDVTVTHDADDIHPDNDAGMMSIATDKGDVVFLSFVNEGEDEMLVEDITVEFPGADGTGTGTGTSTGTSSGTVTTTGETTAGESTGTSADDTSSDTTSGAGASTDSGCGCTQRQAPGGLLGLLGLLGLTVRRRRSR